MSTESPFTDPVQAKSVFQEIAQLKLQERSIKDKLSKLEAMGKAYMQNTDVTRVETDFGRFGLSFVKTWEYSPLVAEKEAEVKALKQAEEESGAAKVKSTSARLRYDAPKEA